MTLDARSRLKDVVAVVATALRAAKIRVVLTGGACASVHASEKYLSHDVDFILQSAPSQAALDRAMAAAGFRRDGDRYVHPTCPFSVEFPAGPLAIGSDYNLKPVTMLVGRSKVTALSATDSCRDRRAAYYHWDDVQSLAVAVEIARTRRVNLRAIQRWSNAEGAAEKFGQFRRRLGPSRAARDVRI